MEKKELFELLKAETNMTNRDIERHVNLWIFVHPNDESGRQELIDEFLACLGELEDAEEAQESLDVLGAYGADFVEQEVAMTSGAYDRREAYDARNGMTSKAYKLKKSVVAQFKRACDAEGKSQAQVLQDLMASYIDSVDAK